MPKYLPSFFHQRFVLHLNGSYAPFPATGRLVGSEKRERTVTSRAGKFRSNPPRIPKSAKIPSSTQYVDTYVVILSSTMLCRNGDWPRRVPQWTLTGVGRRSTWMATSWPHYEHHLPQPQNHHYFDHHRKINEDGSGGVNLKRRG